MQPVLAEAAEKQDSTIGEEHSAAVAAAVAAAAVAAPETTVAATAGCAPTVVPAQATIAVVDLPVGEHVQDKVTEDLEQEKRKREVHDEIEEMFEENWIKDLDEDFRKGAEFDKDAIDELSEEDDINVDYSMDSRHSKSRYTLKHLKAGKINYCFRGKIGYPFCSKIIATGFDSLIQHANGIADGSVRKHQASTLAKHAAFGVFLSKYVMGNETFYIPPVKKAKK